MTTLTLYSAILADRAAFYGVTIDDFIRPGTTFRIVRGLDGESTLYHTVLGRRTFISCGPQAREGLMNSTEQGRLPLVPAMIEGIFPEAKVSDSYPHLIHRGEKLSRQPLPPGYAIRSMSPDHHPPLQAFLDQCSEEDIDDALIILDDPDEEIRMIYEGDVPVAYAGYRAWESGLGDTGILVKKEYRGRGLGVAAVGAVTAACLKRGRIPFYRTSRGNPGSLGIALKLGYELTWETTSYRW